MARWRAEKWIELVVVSCPARMKMKVFPITSAFLRRDPGSCAFSVDDRLGSRAWPWTEAMASALMISIPSPCSPRRISSSLSTKSSDIY